MSGSSRDTQGSHSGEGPSASLLKADHRPLSPAKRPGVPSATTAGSGRPHSPAKQSRGPPRSHSRSGGSHGSATHSGESDQLGKASGSTPKSTTPRSVETLSASSGSRGIHSPASHLRGKLGNISLGTRSPPTRSGVKPRKLFSSDPASILDEPPSSGSPATGHSHLESPQSRTPLGSATGLGVINEDKCRGCDFDKKSLRGHLERTSKPCKQLYSKDELKALEDHAVLRHKENTAHWKKSNREMINEQERQRSKILCNICDKLFATKGAHDLHMTEVHNPVSISCSECKQTFSSLRNKNRHLMEQHKGVATLSCDVCQESFTRQERLSRHISQVHLGVKLFSCPKCDAVFSRKGNMNRHIFDVHKELVRYECDQCPMISARWENLKVHLLEVHDKERKYHCDQCPERYARWKSLNRHISVVHDKATLFHCPVCSKHFHWKEKMNRHISDVHKEEQGYECDQCPETFSRWENLQRHLTRGKHTDEYECQFCHEDELFFKTKSEAQKHFLFYKNSNKVYSCINKEKRRKEYKKNEWKHIQELREKIEIESERRARGELTQEEAKNILEAKEEHDDLYRPYDFDESFIDPHNGLPMHDPVRGKCGHTFDRQVFIDCMKKYPNRADMCPTRKYDLDKKKLTGCEEKISLSDLEVDVEMNEEIKRRKEKRKKQKEAGLWKPDYGHDGDKRFDVLPCKKCDKIFDYQINLDKHIKEIHTPSGKNLVTPSGSVCTSTHDKASSSSVSAGAGPCVPVTHSEGSRGSQSGLAEASTHGRVARSEQKMSTPSKSTRDSPCGKASHFKVSTKSGDTHSGAQLSAVSRSTGARPRDKILQSKGPSGMSSGSARSTTRSCGHANHLLPAGRTGGWTKDGSAIICETCMKCFPSTEDFEWHLRTYEPCAHIWGYT